MSLFKDVAILSGAGVGGGSLVYCAIPQSWATEALFNIPFTAHLLGGAVIGATPGSGVIDSRHRVHVRVVSRFADNDRHPEFMAAAGAFSGAGEVEAQLDDTVWFVELRKMAGVGQHDQARVR
jgi:hypothetical protein